ncbi:MULTISPECIES: RDD family protein [Arthrobacter]|uniref:RDD family protein n=2 Tax=Arthrobacter TaxID=1663 RepID=A0ABU9KH07_9MICC|nr:RDD family protein [Arthrobacter sp. YJM1]MDP5226180.1 RDD family protein [Arthrobacter sp. YJM1]
MVTRRDLGSWLEGPDTSHISKYPGERLGLPETGPGSLGRAGRRILAICIDWGLCLLISNAFFGGNSWATLAVFFAEQAILIGTLGYSVGHRVSNIHVIKLDGTRAGIPAALVRAALLCLVIPAVIVDADHRGLHDKAMKTILVRR